MPSPSRGTVLPVRVNRVVDGDTVRVTRRGFRWWFGGGDIVVRLYGIDAPESDQKHGPASTRAMAKILRGGRVRLEVMDTDRYGRTVGLLYHEKHGRDRSANLRLVEVGLAFAYTRYGGSELGFGAAERTAADKRAGMWADARIRRGLDRPWDHRERQRHSEARAVRLRFILWIVLILVLLGVIAVAYSLLSSGPFAGGLF